MASNPGMTIGEASAQVDQNAGLNTKLTSAFGFSSTGPATAQFKNFKFDSATIKSQFGSLGEEPSVAISKSAGDSQKSVAFPFNETDITVPTSVADTFKGTADKFGSLLADAGSAVKGSDLSTTLGGMFNSAGTTISSVVSGVGSGITSTFDGIKGTLTAAAKQLGAITKIESPEQKFALKSNPLASLEDQASTFKSYANKLEAESTPSLDQLKNQFGSLTNSASGSLNSLLGGIGSRVQGLSTLFDKSPTVATNATSASSIADVIKQSTEGSGAVLNNLSNNVSADALAAKQSRAQLFPADSLESKLKSVGESLKPSIVSLKDSIGSSLPSSLTSTNTANIDQAQVDKDVVTLQRQDPTLTEAEARDQATRSQQLNKSLTSAFGFKI